MMGPIARIAARWIIGAVVGAFVAMNFFTEEFAESVRTDSDLLLGLELLLFGAMAFSIEKIYSLAKRWGWET